MGEHWQQRWGRSYEVRRREPHKCSSKRRVLSPQSYEFVTSTFKRLRHIDFESGHCRLKSQRHSLASKMVSTPIRRLSEATPIMFAIYPHRWAHHSCLTHRLPLERCPGLQPFTGPTNIASFGLHGGHSPFEVVAAVLDPSCSQHFGQDPSLLT